MTRTTPRNALSAELWTADQIAAFLGCTQRCVHGLTAEGRIDYFLAGKQLRFDPADVAAYIEREKKRQRAKKRSTAGAAKATGTTTRRGRPRAVPSVNWATR